VTRTLATAATFAALVLVPGVARAESRECAAAAEAGQLLRNSGKLVQARDQLLTCMKVCPRLVQNDCGPWLHDVEARLASIVIRATDPSGREITDVRVMVDGTALTSRLDGLAVPVDPGVRKLTFEHDGHPTIVQDVTIREGEKARAITVRFEDPPVAKPEPPPYPPHREARLPTSAIILGGVGVVGMGLFTVYHVSAKNDLDTLREGCAPRCPESEVEAVDRKIFVSNVALGVGIAALAAAVVVWIVEGRAGSPGSTAASRNSLLLRF
jgi:hypothetical protein